MRLALLILLAVFSGCAVVPREPGPAEREASWERRVEELAAHDSWDFTGRIAVKTADDAWSASLRWRQVGESYRVNLWGPLGRTLARLDGSPYGVTLRTSDGTYYAQSPEHLLYSELGWQLPVSGMRHWVRGLPAPEDPIDVLQLDAIGRPERMEQSGWQLAFPEYERYSLDALPGRVLLSRDLVSIRLLAESWGIPVP